MGSTRSSLASVVLRPVRDRVSVARSISMASTSTLTSELAATPTTPGTPEDGAFNMAAFSSRNMSSTDLLHAELRLMLAGRPALCIPRTPDAPLGPGSSKEEVAEWLKIKGFNEDVARRLVGLEGKTLLALKKADIERLLAGHVDPKEIWRLDSQIKMQRARNPMNTARTSEFNAVLARARRKAEEAAQERTSTC